MRRVSREGFAKLDYNISFLCGSRSLVKICDYSPVISTQNMTILGWTRFSSEIIDFIDFFFLSPCMSPSLLEDIEKIDPEKNYLDKGNGG